MRIDDPTLQGNTTISGTLSTNNSAKVLSLSATTGVFTTSISAATYLGLPPKLIGFNAFDTTKVPTGKIYGFATCPIAGTISAYSFTIDAGIVTVKAWKIAAGTAKPTATNSINLTGVSITSGTNLRSTTLTDFLSTAVAANDVFAFNVETNDTAKEINFQLEITRS